MGVNGRATVRTGKKPISGPSTGGRGGRITTGPTVAPVVPAALSSVESSPAAAAPQNDPLLPSSAAEEGIEARDGDDDADGNADEEARRKRQGMLGPSIVAKPRTSDPEYRAEILRRKKAREESLGVHPALRTGPAPEPQNDSSSSGNSNGNSSSTRRVEFGTGAGADMDGLHQGLSKLGIREGRREDGGGGERATTTSPSRFHPRPLETTPDVKIGSGTESEPKSEHESEPESESEPEPTRHEEESEVPMGQAIRQEATTTANEPLGENEQGNLDEEEDTAMLALTDPDRLKAILARRRQKVLEKIRRVYQERAQQELPSEVTMSEAGPERAEGLAEAAHDDQVPENAQEQPLPKKEDEIRDTEKQQGKGRGSGPRPSAGILTRIKDGVRRKNGGGDGGAQRNRSGVKKKG